MTDELAQEVMKISVRLLDDAHSAWLAAESECDRALRVWLRRRSPDRTAAYSSYRAALDREEAAARDLQRLSELVEPAEQQLCCRDSAT